MLRKERKLNQIQCYFKNTKFNERVEDKSRKKNNNKYKAVTYGSY